MYLYSIALQHLCISSIYYIGTMGRCTLNRIHIYIYILCICTDTWSLRLGTNVTLNSRGRVSTILELIGLGIQGLGFKFRV